MAKIVETTPQWRSFTLDLNEEEVIALVYVLGKQPGEEQPIQHLYEVLEKALRR